MVRQCVTGAHRGVGDTAPMSGNARDVGIAGIPRKFWFGGCDSARVAASFIGMNAQNDKFDRILSVVRTIIELLADSRVSDYEAQRHITSLNAATARLSALIDALSMDELAAFGEYQKGERA